MTAYAQKVWQQTAIFLLAPVPIILISYYIDTRTLNDIALWTKPLKFHFSAALHLATFALLVRLMPEPQRTAKWLAVLAFVSAAATIFEVFLIDMQAMRGVHSHFNFSTQKDVSIYQMMGVAAVILTLPALILGIRYWFLPSSNLLTPGLKLGAALGLTMGFILTLLIAGYMSSLPTGHWVGTQPTDADGVPIFGWSRTGGDLRVPHFFATHLMQILPLVGWLLDKLLKGQKRNVILSVSITSLILVGLTIWTFIQAMQGQPFVK